MGVLDDAIREHLELKRQRGASDEEIASAEAEALGPARRPATAALEEEPGPGPGEPLLVEPVEDVAPPPPAEATRVLHDIDEDPTAPPPPARGAPVVDAPVEEGPADAPPIEDEPPVETPDRTPESDEDERLWGDGPGPRDPGAES